MLVITTVPAYIAALLPKPILNAHQDTLNVVSALLQIGGSCAAWRDEFNPNGGSYAFLPDVARNYVALREAYCKASLSVALVPFHRVQEDLKVRFDDALIIADPFHEGTLGKAHHTLYHSFNKQFPWGDDDIPAFPSEGSEVDILGYLEKHETIPYVECDVSWEAAQLLKICLQNEAIRAGALLTNDVRSRMSFDDKGCRVKLDDTWHEVSTTAFTLLKACWESYPRPAYANQLDGDIRPANVNDSLPRQLKAIFFSEKGKGCRLELR